VEAGRGLQAEETEEEATRVGTRAPPGLALAPARCACVCAMRLRLRSRPWNTRGVGSLGVVQSAGVLGGIKGE
jgi:hypothetical protein